MIKQVSLMIGVFVLGAILGGALTFMVQDQRTFQAPPAVAPVLGNPGVVAWSVNVEGRVVAKDGQSVTLQTDGSEVNIPVNSATLFLDSRGIEFGKGAPKKITFSDIQVGMKLSANATFDKNAEAYFGSVLTVLDE